MAPSSDFTDQVVVQVRKAGLAPCLPIAFGFGLHLRLMIIIGIGNQLVPSAYGKMS